MLLILLLLVLRNPDAFAPGGGGGGSNSKAYWISAPVPAHRGLSEDENALVPISPVGTADYLADDFSFGLDIDLAGAAARPSALRPT